MELVSKRIIAAPPAEVWNALNDPAVLKECIPGCESLERVSDVEWRAVVAARVGPVAARFNGKVMIADVVAPTAYTLKFEGQGGAAGFAKGEAKVTLAPTPDGHTELSYAAKAQVGGKLAQIGSRLIDGVAAKLAEEFFAAFAARLAPAETAATSAEGGAVAAAPERLGLPGGASWIRYAALAAIIVLLIILYTRGLH